MKAIEKVASIGIAAAISISCICSSVFANMQTSAEESKVPEGIVYTEGTHFMCDGEPFYFAGCNSYDLFTLGDGSSTATNEDIETKFMYKDQIDSRMQQMEDNGVTVLRTWGFSNETWHGFELAPGEYNEAEFMLFDYIMYSAQEHNIRVIITLENYWEAYGGIDEKLSWAGLSGGSHTNRAQYFSNEQCKQWYKDYAKHFAERTNYFTGEKYKDDPTVFAWDLMNEPRYQDAGEDSTGITLRAWVDEMAEYIKSIDTNHMVYAGLEGHGTRYNFGGDEGNPFVYIQQSPYIDFCSAHPYPDEHWANMTVEDTRIAMIKWIEDSHNEVGKPFVVTEFNVHSSLPEAEYEEYWHAVFDTIEEYDAAGGLFWEFNDRKLSEFTVMNGDAILDYFKKHSENMQNKAPMNSLSAKIKSVNIDEPTELELTYLMMTGKAAGLQIDDKDLIAGKDYTMADGKITLSVDAVSNLSIGMHTVKLVTTEGNQPTIKIEAYSKASQEAKRSIIDNFESYDDNTAISIAYSVNRNGDTLNISLETENVKNGNSAMKYEYSVANGGPGYCGATKNFGSADWSGFDGIKFWILSDGSNRETTIQFVDGAGAYWESIQKVTAGEGWKEVKIPFSDFHNQQWGVQADAPTLEGVKEISIYAGPNGNPGTGTWYFDDIGLYKEGVVGTTTTTETTTTTTETTTTTTDTTTTTSGTGTSDTGSVPGDVLYGDTNLDGTLSMIDIVYLNKFISGAMELNDQQLANAQCYISDPEINGRDANALMQRLAEQIKVLPVKD